jgi:hypothetical protein
MHYPAFAAVNENAFLIRTFPSAGLLFNQRFPVTMAVYAFVQLFIQDN